MGAVPGQRPLEVLVVREVDDRTARRLYQLYVETFGDMSIRAVNRHLLHEEEFMAQMFDPRVVKYVVPGPDGSPVAMCTLTNDLETVPWISPDYYAHHYPEHAARGAVYFLGFILVAPGERRGGVFSALVHRVASTLAAEGALCGYDVCRYNDEQRRMAEAIAQVLGGVADIEVRAEDVQTFYTAIAPPISAEMSRLPSQRSTLEPSGQGATGG